MPVSPEFYCLTANYEHNGCSTAKRSRIPERTDEGGQDAGSKAVKPGQKRTFGRTLIQETRTVSMVATEMARKMKITPSMVYSILNEKKHL